MSRTPVALCSLLASIEPIGVERFEGSRAPGEPSTLGRATVPAVVALGTALGEHGDP